MTTTGDKRIANGRRRTFVRALVAFALVIAGSFAARAQVELQFSDSSPTLELGTALTQGARYRFRTVAPGTDALVTLTTITGATLVTLDDNTSSASRFQPVIRTTGTNVTTSYVRFDFQLVAAGTSTARTVPAVFLSAQDVDGNGVANGIREWVEFSGTNAVSVSASTLLSSTTAVAGGTRYIQSNSTNSQAGIGTDDRYEVYTSLNSALSTFTVVGGSVTGTGGCPVGDVSCDRQFSYAFDPASSNQTTPAPDLSLAVSAPYAVAPSTIYTTTLTVTNNGPTSANGSTLSASLPAAFVPTAWNCAGSGGAVCGTITSAQDIFIPTFPSGGQAVFTLSGYYPSAGTYTTSATASPPNGSTDPNTSNNSASVTTQIGNVADLRVVTSQRSGTSGSFQTTSLSANRLTTIQYQLVVTNLGSSSVSGATFGSTIPSNVTGLTVVSATGALATTCTASFGTSPNQNVLTGSFSASSSGTCTVIVQGTLGTAGTITTTGTVAPTNYAAAGDPDCTNSPIVCGGNNTSSVSTTITSVYTIGGTVFEDANYGGGSGRSLSGASGTGVSGARVELYDSTGAFAASTTTGAGGTYQFTVASAANYTVRVVNSTVVSSRAGYVSGLLPVQTFRTNSGAADLSRVGGEDPAKADAASNTTNLSLSSLTNASTTAQSISTVDSTNSPTGVDFGFNFDTVVNTANSGQGSLRQAITNANTLGGDSSLGVAGRTAAVEHVVFMIPNGTTGGGGSLSLSGGLRSSLNYFTTSAGSYNVATISPTSGLPAVTSTLVIDAQTQPGWTLEPIIEINGTSAGVVSGIALNASSIILRGFVINRFGVEGVVSSSGNGIVIQGCWIGLNAAGTAAAANANSGIWMSVTANNHQIGGTTAAQRNVIAGNTSFEGVAFAGGSGHVVSGNYIGTNAAGSAAILNGRFGVLFYGSVTGATVGGTTPGAGNVIGGSGQSGIVVEGSNVVIQGNYIGLNAGGTAAVANSRHGILVQGGGQNVTIGGTSVAARNFIGGNGWEGIAINGASPSNSTVQGNYIGTNATGTATIPNGTVNAGSTAGVYVGQSGVTVGGTAAGAGNLIRGNVGAGVAVVNSATGNGILGNSIYGNGGLGIDLLQNGATANDGAKTAGQPNVLMDFPTITSSSLSGTTLTVAGYVGSAAGQTTFASSRVEVFVSDASTPRGQGQTYLGFLTADANGNFSGTITGVAGVTPGTTKLVATATDASSNTSEFGLPATVGVTVSGTVFEDANYGGGAGRSLAASGGAGVSGARVELYDGSGNFAGATTTASGGTYQFAALVPGSYTVRVVNSTVVSNRTGYVSGLLGVQTFRTNAGADDTSRVGGEDPAKTDAASNTTNLALASLTNASATAQSIAGVSAASDVPGVDFGFNFDTVVNAANSGQGSLRQVITNANALGGDSSLAQASRTSAIENVVFMISNGTTGSGGSLSLSGGLRSSLNYFTTSAGAYNVATISPTAALPSIDFPLVLDAQTQPGWTAAPVIEINGTSVGASSYGLRVYAGGSTIRGFVVNRVNGNGIELNNVGGNTVQGCYVGTNAAGSAVSANTGVGINMFNSPNNRIGGTSANTGNVISGNSTNAVVFSGTSSGGQMQGNIIGLDANGTTRLGGVGVYVGSANVTVGGTTASARNVISGATYENIQFGSGSTGSVLQGNYIGTNASGATGITNGWANVYINGVSGVTIGGTAAGAGNVIAGSGGFGVAVAGNVTGNAILGNRIYGNSALAIDLAADGPTANDNAKPSGQPNLLMDFPTITSASVVGTTLTVAGYIGTAANQSTFGLARVEIFVSDASTPRGQGQTYLGFVTADGNGNFSGSITGVSGVTLGTTKLVATATDGSNNTSEFGTPFSYGLSIAGTVFEDASYAGGAGRTLVASGGTGRGGATVELYDSGGSLAATTTTASGGSAGFYSFANLANGTYTVRVVNSTVTSARTGYIAGLLPVQTFRTSSGAADTARVGGEDPAKADAAANSGSQTLAALTTSTNTPQSVASVTLSGSGATGVDFGFNFDTIVNVNNAGQGSLRQFITNANALSGADTSIFMIPDGVAHAGLRAGLASQLTSGVAVINVSSALPAVTDSSTTLDATTQTSNVGNTNSGSLGAGGTVGVDALSLPTVARPEVQLSDGTANLNLGFDLQASSAIVRGFAIYGFGTASNVDTSANIRVGSAATSALIEQNVLGSTAVSFADPGASRTNADNIRLITASGTTIRYNLIGFATGKGVAVENGSTGALIQANEIRGNAIQTNNLDGIDFEDAATTSCTATGNLIVDNEGVGIDTHASNGGLSITNNTISGNGIGGLGETAGIRVYGQSSTISKNIVNANYGAGIQVFNSAARNVISQNSIFANGTITSRYGQSASGQIGIDLNSPTDQHQRGTAPFVTPNDNGDADSGGNGLLNFPVLETVQIANGNLVAKGFAPAGATIEFFVSDGDPSGFGEGQTYVFTATEGSGADADATTGSYTSPYNGNALVGTETTNRFRFAIPLPGGVSAGTKITATATVSSFGTSEFGNTATVSALGPVVELVKTVTPQGTQLPGTDLTFTIDFANNGGASAGNFTLTDPNPANPSMRISANMQFKVGSVVVNTGTTGLAATVTYSNDDGATYSYTPASGAGGAPAGYDANVTNIRWTFAGSFPSVSPNNTGSVSFTARIK